MTAVSIGLALWLVAALATARLMVISRTDLPAPRAKAWVWALLLIAAVGMFFRPHGDVFGGQDTGAYANSAAAVARERALTYDDPMLEALDPAERTPFLVSKWHASKYDCLWLPDPASPRMAPWFFPAFSMLGGATTSLLGAQSILYVVPLFALLTAFALSVLARRVLNHRWAGELAFWFYITIPLLVWHARFTRPEIIASFFLASGGALLLHAASAGRYARWPDLVLGAVCMNLAPFFHMTAWMVLLPVFVLAVVTMLAGRDDFVLFIAIGFAAFGVLIHQTLHVCDPYRLIRYIGPLVAGGCTPLLIALLAMAGLFGISRAVGRATQDGLAVRRRAERWMPWVLAIAAFAIVLVFVNVFGLSIQTEAAILKRQTMRFVHRTDLRCVTDMLSMPLSLLGLAGLVALGWPFRAHPLPRFALIAAAVPASLMIGNMYDFFMTRYMATALIPLLALALTALVTAIPARTARGIAALLVATAAVTAVGMTHRLHLVTAQEYKGFTRYLERVAAPLKAENAMIFVEYSRIAAPLDLMFGVSALAVDNARVLNYGPAERSWRKLMRAHPDRPAYFITPFEREPASPLFNFQFKGESAYEGVRMISQRWSLPRELGPWGCRLRVYRMTLAGATEPRRRSPRLPCAV